MPSHKIAFVHLNEMKFYLYRSKAKVEMLYSQLEQPRKKKIKWKIDLKRISRETETDSSDVTLEQKLQDVLRELEYEEQIGSIEDGKPYIKAILPMRWGYTTTMVIVPLIPVLQFILDQLTISFCSEWAVHHII